MVTALGVSACSRDAVPNAPAPQSPISETDGFGPTAPTPSDAGPLPAPEALSDVIARLADPAVPGSDKLTLVEGATPADAAALDSFATALRDNGFAPPTVRAYDIVPSGPGVLVATVTITGSGSASDNTASGKSAGEFSFPMEFRRVGNGWQLTRQTADMLLTSGNARTAEPAARPTPPR